jgi:hypothetical protein
MIALVTELEMRGIETMPRNRLLDAIKDRWEFLPADLRLRIEEQSNDRLRMILLAIRLMYFLRNSRYFPQPGPCELN